MPKTTKLNHKEQLAMVDKFYWRAQGIAESTNDWDRYLDQIRQEEKSHRRFCPDGIRCGLTLQQAVRLFAVTDLLRARAGEEKPDPADFFRFRTAIFMGYALYMAKKELFDQEFSEAEAKAYMADVDYAALNKDPRNQ